MAVFFDNDVALICQELSNAQGMFHACKMEADETQAIGNAAQKVVARVKSQRS